MLLHNCSAQHAKHHQHLYKHTCIERRLEPLLERDSSGGLRLVAPRPDRRLFSNDGDRAQMNAWNDDTVNTCSLFRMVFVCRATCDIRDCQHRNETEKSDCWVYYVQRKCTVLEYIDCS